MLDISGDLYKMDIHNSADFSVRSESATWQAGNKLSHIIEMDVHFRKLRGILSGMQCQLLTFKLAGESET